MTVVQRRESAWPYLVSDGGDVLSSDPSDFSARKPPRLFRASILAAADTSAFCAAVTCGYLLAQALVWERGLGTALPSELATLIGFAVFMLGVILYLASCAHYQSRVPYWSQLRSVTSASVIALLSHGCLAFFT